MSTARRPPALAPGTTLGGLRIGALLGRGAMGEVYGAEQISLGRRVAVKRIADHLVGDAEAMVRFEREARTVAALHHPNVLVVHDLVAGVVDAQGREHTLLVMELVDGAANAGSWAAEKSWQQIVVLLSQAATGLAAVHAAGVIHRDIKPDNLLVAGDGTVKIGDFGLARHQDATVMTVAGTCMGTPAYMSPEVCAGDVAGAPADVYSLGATAYHLLTGHIPFQGSSQVAMLHAHCYNPVPDLAAERADLPAELVGLIRQCLAKVPTERPEAAAMALRLSALVNEAGDLQATLVSAPVPAPVSAPTAVGRTTLVVGGIAGATLLGLGLWWWSSATPATPGADQPSASHATVVAAPAAADHAALQESIAAATARLAAGQPRQALDILTNSRPIAERCGRLAEHDALIQRIERLVPGAQRPE